MKTIKAYVVLRNGDQTEGRGPMIPVGYVRTREDALKIVTNPLFYKKHGVHGCPPYGNGEYDVREESIKIFDSFDEFMKWEFGISDKELLKMNEEEAKQALETKIKNALNKLTQEEKVILGLG